MEELKNNQAASETADTETPLDKNVRLMSPTRMKDICRHVTPEYKEYGEGHFAACHLLDGE